MSIACPYCEGTGKVTAEENYGIGDLMRLSRQNKKYTLREAEAVSGVSNAYISQIETGKIKKPSLDFIVKLCDAYGIEISELIKLQKEKS